MSIAELIRRGKGKAGAWRIEPAGPTGRVALVHYSTPMLSWNPNGDDPEPNILSIGWGSVSDQNGMNTAFKVLNLPLYYSRDIRGGGPRIDTLPR